MKGNPIGVRLRRQTLFDMMLLGETPTKLREQWLLTNDSLSEHSFEKDITWCYNKLSKFNLKNAEDIINHHIIMYDENIKQARELGAIGAANQAMQYKEKLLGLHKPEVLIQNNSVNLDLKDISLDELKKLINE